MAPPDSRLSWFLADPLIIGRHFPFLVLSDTEARNALKRKEKNINSLPIHDSIYKCNIDEWEQIQWPLRILFSMCDVINDHSVKEVISNERERKRLSPSNHSCIKRKQADLKLGRNFLTGERVRLAWPETSRDSCFSLLTPFASHFFFFPVACLPGAPLQVGQQMLFLL